MVKQQLQNSVLQHGKICPLVPALQPEVLVVEKLKRGGAMKTQATQTDVKRNAQALAGQQLVDQQIPDSPRSVNRVRQAFIYYFHKDCKLKIPKLEFILS